MKISISGIGPLLTLIFMVLKLTGYIDWNWIWILSPIWAPLVIVTVLGLVVGIIKVFYLD